MNELSAAIKIQENSQASLTGERIYEALKDAILDGAIRQGHLLTEVGIAEIFGVSRTPVREALHKLEAEELLVTLPRKGLTVNSLRFADGIALYDASIVIEAQAASLAAQNRNTSQLMNMEICIANMRECADKLDGKEAAQKFAALNYDFHLLVAEASSNKYLYSFVCELRAKMRLLNTSLVSLKVHENAESNGGVGERDKAEDHDNIFEAIKKGDSELAGLLMKRHLTASRSFFYNTHSKKS